MGKTKIKRILANRGGFKRIGIMFIVVGFFIPLVLYPFTELTKDVKEKADLLLAVRGVKYTPRLNELKIIIRDSYKKSYTAYPPFRRRGDKPQRYTKEIEALSVRYPYIIALGLTFIFVGISIIVLTGKKSKKE
jgi:hypothetical protein